MNQLTVAFLTYAILMAFTPGPNNVSASTLGVRVGYMGSLSYLKWVGAAYMAWLALSLFLHASQGKAAARDGYAGRLLVQFVNPGGRRAGPCGRERRR
jgi:threonine/homoserine/homoserine lactone efflux protein